MGVGSGLYMYDVVIKRSRSLSHLLMSGELLLTFWHSGAYGYKGATVNDSCTEGDAKSWSRCVLMFNGIRLEQMFVWKSTRNILFF